MRFHFWMLVCFLFFSGCDSDDPKTSEDTQTANDTAGSDTSPGTDTGTGTDTTGGPTVTLTGSVTNSVDSTDIEGASVCVFENSAVPCATTDAQGDYTLPGVPADSEVLIEVSATTFVPTLVHITTGSEDLSVSSGLIDSTAALVGASAFNVTLNLATQGVIGFLALDTSNANARVPGVSLTIAPQNGEGPYYVDDNATPDPNLTETSNTGAGSYFNLDPDTYTVTPAHASLTCQANFAHVDPNGGFKVRIVAGYLSAFSVDCQ